MIDLLEAVESDTGTETAVVDSEPLEVAALKATVGGESSSLMMAVTCWVPDSVPLVTPEISTMTVSSTSSKVSCTAVRVIVPLVLPEGMTIEAPEVV